MVAGLAALTLGVALGSSGRLTYHEAIHGQAAREIIDSGDWLVPTLGGVPWVEKPPGPIWAAAAAGWLAGGVDEAASRLPGTVSGGLVALAVATLAAMRFGPRVGLLAGCVQATTLWLVTRGRLAEADVPLAAVVAWALVAFDRLRDPSTVDLRRPAWRLAFFLLLGATALAKGVGFGGALVLATVVATLIWDRDRKTARALAWPIGWGLAAVIALAWPALVMARHPEALGVWAVHVTDRFAAKPAHFAGEAWGPYLLGALGMTLPWTPWAVGGALRSWRRARRPSGRSGVDRLLLTWAVVPSTIVSASTARNAHYLVHALPPLAIWAALGLRRTAARLRRRGWSRAKLRRTGVALFGGLGIVWAAGYAIIAPRLDARGKGAEWAFCERAGRRLPEGEPIVLLHDALGHPDRWDRLPYPTPFGPVPPDLAPRLFYLARPAGSVSWAFGPEDLAEFTVERGRSGFAVLARARDRASLEALGAVESIAEGPSARWDRAFDLLRVRPRGGQWQESR